MFMLCFMLQATKNILMTVLWQPKRTVCVQAIHPVQLSTMHILCESFKTAFSSVIMIQNQNFEIQNPHIVIIV